MKTIIMAGGKGSRISGLFPDIPKPLIPIGNVPVLEREILSLGSQGFTDIILTVSYMGSKIKEYFGDGKRLGVSIQYYTEDVPLGNAGALFKLRDTLGDEDFLLLNADAAFDVDFNRMVEYHKAHRALVTLFTHPNSHPYDSGLIIADECGRVEKWLAKEDARPRFYKNRVNAGLHVVNPAVLDLSGIDPDKVGNIDGSTGKTIKIDLDRQILKPLASSGGDHDIPQAALKENAEKAYNKENKKLKGRSGMFCYDSPEYVKDMGTPERYHAVAEDFQKGIVEGKNLRNRQKAIFLDRDGTINKYVGFLRNIDEFELEEGAAEAVRKINASGYLAVVCTNQPVIARGEVSFEELHEIHNKMETLLGLSGAYLDAVYFCPHHPHKGYEGEVAELKTDCNCRKPKPGMLLEAAKDFHIDLGKSWMVGDSENDVLAGKNAGCRTVFIGEAREGTGADMTAGSLADAIDKIMGKNSL